MPRALHDRPALAALIGAVAIAFSGILFRVAHVSPSTGAVFRCLYALPPLWLLARWEDRRYGPRPLKQRRLAWIAGLFFAVDLIAWHQGIEEVGAGLATVLGNLQVVLVGLLAWAFLRERPSNRSLAAIPVALFGVILISGVLEHGAYGRNPGLGVAFGILTAASYAGFLLVLRQGNKDLRRPAGPLFDATLASGAGVHRDRARDREPRLDSRLAGTGLPPAARAQLAGRRLAADLDHPAASPGRPHLGAADLPAGARGPVRLGDPERVAVGAPTLRGRARALRPPDRLGRPITRRPARSRGTSPRGTQESLGS